MSDDGPTLEEWAAMTWDEKMFHNLTAWEAHFDGKSAIQWWAGTEWRDESPTAKDYEVVCIEHPQRVKPEVAR